MKVDHLPRPMKTIAVAISAVTLVSRAKRGYADPTGVETNSDAKQVKRGRYVVKITGCNDCHTPGYAQAHGKVPENQWLMGDRLRYRGTWGTTYPSNLRFNAVHGRHLCRDH